MQLTILFPLLSYFIYLSFYSKKYFIYAFICILGYGNTRRLTLLANMQSSALDMGPINAYVRQHKLYILIEGLGEITEQLEKKIEHFQINKFNGEEKAAHTWYDDIKNSKMSPKRLFQLVAMEIKSRKNFKHQFVNYNAESLSQTVLRVGYSRVWKSYFSNLLIDFLKVNFSTTQIVLLQKAICVTALRCCEVLSRGNTLPMHSTCKWFDHVLRNPQVGAILAFSVVFFWKRLASIGIRCALKETELQDNYSLEQIHLLSNHSIKNNDRYYEETYFFRTLCYACETEDVLLTLPFISSTDPIGNVTTKHFRRFLHPQSLKRFAFLIFRSCCLDAPLEIWNTFLDTAQLVTKIIVELRKQEFNPGCPFPHSRAILTQEAIVLRSLLIFSTGQHRTWARAVACTTPSSSEDRSSNWSVEDVPKDVSLDVWNVFQMLKTLEGTKMKNNDQILYSALVLSDLYGLWSLQPYTTTWLRYCTLSTESKELDFLTEPDYFVF